MTMTMTMRKRRRGGRTWSPGMVTTQRIMMRVMMRT